MENLGHLSDIERRLHDRMEELKRENERISEEIVLNGDNFTTNYLSKLWNDIQVNKAIIKELECIFVGYDIHVEEYEGVKGEWYATYKDSDGVCQFYVSSMSKLAIERFIENNSQYTFFGKASQIKSEGGL